MDERIAVQEYEDNSGDCLNNVFGISSQHSRQFTSTNHEDSQDSSVVGLARPYLPLFRVLVFWGVFT
jgi:hypothetical protein